MIVSEEFSKEFYKLPPNVQQIAKKRLKMLEENPFKGEPLKYELLGFYSLHFEGNRYRMIYTIKEDTIEVLALSIGKRVDNFYKKVQELIERKSHLDYAFH